MRVTSDHRHRELERSTAPAAKADAPGSLRSKSDPVRYRSGRGGSCWPHRWLVAQSRVSGMILSPAGSFLHSQHKPAERRSASIGDAIVSKRRAAAQDSCGEQEPLSAPAKKTRSQSSKPCFLFTMGREHTSLWAFVSRDSLVPVSVLIANSTYRQGGFILKEGYCK
jgi:hypothetical protein